MRIFVSFVAGATLFYLHSFSPMLPLVSFFPFFIIRLSMFRRDKAGALQKKRCLRFISSLVLPLIILSLSYYLA